MPTNDDTVALQLRVAELEREVAALRKQLHPAPQPDHAQRDQSARQRYEHWKQAYGNLFADAAGPDEAEEPVCSSSGSSTPEGTVRQRSTDGDDSDISSCGASTFSLSPAVQQPAGQWGSEHGHVTAAALGGSPASPMAALSMQAAAAVTLSPMQQAMSPGMWHAAADAAVAGASASVDVGGSKRRSGHLHPASPPLGHAHASGPAVLGLSRQATRLSPTKRNRRYSGSDAHARSTSTSSITSGGPLPWSRAPVAAVDSAAASTAQPLHLNKPRCSAQPVGSSQATDIHPDGPDVAASSNSWLQSTPARHQQHAPPQLLLVSLPTPSLMAGSMPSPLPAPSDYLGTSSSDDESEDEQGDSPRELRQGSGVCRPRFGSQADSLDALPRALQELAGMNGWRVRQDQDAECSAAAGEAPREDACDRVETAGARVQDAQEVALGPGSAAAPFAQHSPIGSIIPQLACFLDDSDIVTVTADVATVDATTVPCLEWEGSYLLHQPEVAAVSVQTEGEVSVGWVQAQHAAVDGVLDALVAETVCDAVVDGLVAEVQELRGKLASCSGEQQQQVCCLVEQAQSLSVQLDSREEAMQQLTAQLVTQQQEVQQVAAQLVSKEAEAQEATALLHSRDAEVQEVTSRMQEREQEVVRLRGQLKEVEGRQAQHAWQLRVKEGELQQLRGQLAALQAERGSQVAGLEGEVGVLRGQVEVREGQIKTLTEELEGARTELLLRDGQIVEQRQLLVASEEQAMLLSAQLNMRQEAAVEQVQQLAQREGEMQRLRAQLEEHSSQQAQQAWQLRVREGELQQARAQLEAVLSEQVRLEEQLREGQKALQEAEQRAQRADALSVERGNRVGEVEAEVEGLRVQLGDRQAEAQRLSGVVQQQAAELERLRGAKAEQGSEEDVLSARVQVQRLTQELHELNWRLRVQQQRCGELEQQLAAAQEAASKQQQTIRDLEGQLASCVPDGHCESPRLPAATTPLAPPGIAPWMGSCGSAASSTQRLLRGDSGPLGHSGAGSVLPSTPGQSLGSMAGGIGPYLGPPGAGSLAPSIFGPAQPAPPAFILSPPQFHTPLGRTAGSYLRNSVAQSREWP